MWDVLANHHCAANKAKWAIWFFGYFAQVVSGHGFASILRQLLLRILGRTDAHMPPIQHLPMDKSKILFPKKKQATSGLHLSLAFRIRCNLSAVALASCCPSFRRQRLSAAIMRFDMALMTTGYRAGPFCRRRVAVAFSAGMFAMTPFRCAIGTAFKNWQKRAPILSLKMADFNICFASSACPLEYLSPARVSFCAVQNHALVAKEQLTSYAARLPSWGYTDHGLSLSIWCSHTKTLPHTERLIFILNRVSSETR